MASSSSAIDNSDYDVFLSFRGTDTRNNFTSHLYKALSDGQIKTFIDESLRRGEEITPALLRIIEGAEISVIVFSSDYASSTFCLEELVNILECRESKAQIVLPIFYKVDPGDVEGQKGSYEKSFGKHEYEFKGKKRCRGEEMSQEDTEKMQRWKSALCRAANLSGWHIDHDSNEAVSIQTIVKDISLLLTWRLTRQSQKGKLISKPLDGLHTVTATLEKIWQCLMNANTSRVGVYGMGGVGKTIIATHIYNRLRDVNSFKHIHWVTVTKESSIYKLQSDIAKKINLDFTKEEDERERAAKLWEALNNRKKFVLILDDMWESFELDEVGIPTSVGGKLLLTTRKQGVCKRMKCEEIVNVKPLPKREARNLFLRESGHQIDDNPKLRDIIESVADECDGLPLAIVAIAKSTRGFVEVYEWRNILRELQKPSDEQNLEMEKVFKILKVSYDRLPNDKYRQCLLYCALYPEDYSIERNELIKYWIGEGLIDELECGQEEEDMGNCLINQLIDASLVERGWSSTTVRMHDVVRDMALTITRKKFLVKAGLQVKDFPKFTDWSVNLERMSVMRTVGLERYLFNLAPNWPELRTLLMQKIRHLIELPDCFFYIMQNLTVLDMSSLPVLRVLPESIVKLKNLRWLNLSSCWSLKHIPSLDCLTNLRYLDFNECKSLEHIPSLNWLTNLRYLNLSLCRSLKRIPSLDCLTNLRYLDLHECQSLEHIPSLDWLTNLRHLNLSVCRLLKRIPSLDCLTNLRNLDLHKCELLECIPSLDCLTNLRNLDLHKCRSLEHIPSLNWLTNLKYLDLSRTNLKELPKGLEKLVNLEELHITDVIELYGLIPSKVLKELFLLQRLRLDGSNIEVEPNGLVNLEYLHTLTVDFKNYNSLNWYLKSRHWQRLRKYRFCTKEIPEYQKCLEEWKYGKAESRLHRRLVLCKNKDSDSEETDTVLPNDVQFLWLMHWDIPLDSALQNGNFANLEILTLKKCNINYLISVVFAQQFLRNLRELQLSDCSYIEEIIGTEEESLNQSSRINYPTIELPKLCCLFLRDLPRLKSIYRGEMKLPSLFKLKIDECENLERLPSSELPWLIDIEIDGSPMVTEFLQEKFSGYESETQTEEDTETEVSSLSSSELEWLVHCS